MIGLDRYSYVRCLFCETGKEDRVVDAVHEKQWGHAIFARRVKTVWQNRELCEEIVPLLPGYVFVYSDREDIPTAHYRRLPHVIRVLSYENGADRLQGRDLEFADWLWRQGGMIGVMEAVQVGDRVEITDDIFKGLNGKITRMNRGRKNICVTLETQNTPMKIYLSYKIVEKTDGAPEPE